MTTVQDGPAVTTSVEQAQVIDLAKAAFDHTVNEAKRHGLISGPRVPGIPRPRRAVD